MSHHDEEFWKSLQRAVDDAQAPSADELAEAEQLLGEVDEAGDAEPLPESFVEALVQDVTASEQEAREQEADGQEAGGHAAATPAKVHDLSSFRGLLAAAAAVMIAPKFLLAASAATVIAVGAFVLRNTTQSLPFQEAVVLLMDETLDTTTRGAAQGRIYLDVIESIGILRDVAEEPGMAGRAQRSLEAIRSALDDDQPFAPTAFGMQHQMLGNQTLASDGDLGARLASMDVLTQQVIYGIRALKAIAAAGNPPGLMVQNEQQLLRIREFAGG